MPIQIITRKRRPISSHSSARNRGFTYLGLLIFIAIIGITSATSLQLGALAQRRSAEEELLAIGAEFRSALISYANATQPGQNRLPSALNDLLKDPRYPNPRRHLRQIYADPITGKTEWGTVLSPDGAGIVGIYSLSNARPIKRGNFDPAFADLTGKNKYSDWKFVVSPTLFSGVPPVPLTTPLSAPLSAPTLTPPPSTPTQ